MKNVKSLLIFLVLFVSSNGYKILYLSPFPGTSHWGMMQNIIHGLLEHGHEITAVTSIKLKQDTPNKNYTEVLVEPMLDKDTYFNQERLFTTTDRKIYHQLMAAWFFGSLTSNYAWENENVQNFIHNDNTKFDLIISEQFFQESWLAFAHKYKTPIITVSTYGYSDTMDNFMGLQTPLSHVPHAFLKYSDEMTFFERCVNVLVGFIDHIGRSFHYIPIQQKQALKYMGHLNTDDDPLPTIDILEKNISLVLSNYHIAFGNPRPKMPGQIDIAGINLNKPSKQLPDDIKKFLDEAKHGVIYFSWGSMLQSSKAPKATIQHIINAFKGLKQRVLWKWENEGDQFPSNIMTKKWMPQKEILEHPNIVLFVTHGGLFGSSEGLYNGVPMFFTPVFGDQRRNAERSTRSGYARFLPFSEINGTNFEENIKEMLSNDKYSKNAKQKSLIFRDNLNDPLEEAIYWIEYVVRHNGAKHLKSHAVNLNFFQYYVLDVLAVFAVVFFGVATLLYKVLKKLFRKNSKNIKEKTN